MSLYEVIFVMVLVGGLAFVQASKGRELDGCAGFGTCCPGKNVTCIGRGPSQNNKTSGRCFCDEDCGRLGDCCLDYRFTCKCRSISDSLLESSLLYLNFSCQLLKHCSPSSRPTCIL